MTRTGLFIALGTSLIVGLVFGIFPELDLKAAALFATGGLAALEKRGDAASTLLLGQLKGGA